MNMVWNQVSRLAVVLVMLLGLLAMGPLASAAPGGNSAAAKACQQGGYAGLVGVQNGAVTSFANTSQCVSYAAQGGQLVGLSVVQPCLNSGYAGLARAEDNTTAFTSEAECVSYAVGGGTLVPMVVPAPSITVTFELLTNPNLCVPIVTLNNFAPGTYDLVSTISARDGSRSYTKEVTVDATGTFGPDAPISSYFKSINYMFSVSAGGVSTDPIPFTC